MAPKAVQSRSARCWGNTCRSIKPLQRLAASSMAISSNAELLPGIDAIDRNNPALLEKLAELRLVPYFRLYSVDMLGSCEYMPQELFECYSQTCEIYPVDDDAVSLINCTDAMNQNVFYSCCRRLPFLMTGARGSQGLRS